MWLLPGVPRGVPVLPSTRLRLTSCERGPFIASSRNSVGDFDSGGSRARDAAINGQISGVRPRRHEDGSGRVRRSDPASASRKRFPGSILSRREAFARPVGRADLT